MKVMATTKKHLHAFQVAGVVLGIENCNFSTKLTCIKMHQDVSACNSICAGKYNMKDKT